MILVNHIIKLYLNYRISDRGDLTIKKVQAQMEGAYECRASNGEGNVSVAANLKVVRETTIIAGKYIFDRKVQTLTCLD